MSDFKCKYFDPDGCLCGHPQVECAWCIWLYRRQCEFQDPQPEADHEPSNDTKRK